ncbi:MAG: Hpt domain-containing protein [Deltaproteobacteria bacterium]|nr:Hpt domain-containing protein [Deltaproteobacteria bacterium]MBW1919736.1 Hpt domain-containing protein [Deltaproteobacteria bacterium]MBW1935881.1 Hpt domain-containing protein [Deltaproteobacteria bacterium]MBW1978528.1 Hpt domain-containing protein [Deltaproteobacteria bacterium]MBW2045324.1 Hpt domain-containing protein [Deltaproteobacteria bacterium]
MKNRFDMIFERLANEAGLEFEDVKEIVETYVETTYSDLLELKAALRTGDAEKTHRKAHSIKGSSRALGLTELSELAGRIDEGACENNLRALSGLVQELDEGYEKIVADFCKWKQR